MTKERAAGSSHELCHQALVSKIRGMIWINHSDTENISETFGCHMEHFIMVFQKKQGKDMSKDKQAVQKLRLSVL